MIRLTVLLCVGLYLTALVLGADHGQKRYGLMLADSQSDRRPAMQVAAAAPAPETPVFIPAQPVIQAAPATLATAPRSAQPDLQTVALITQPKPAPQPAPQISRGLLYTVAARQANVRGGPGRSFAVLDTLSQGEQVLVMVELQPIEGWSRIRIEGDGVEGFISTKLLTRSQ